ncbi:rRNA methyltransferase [Actinoplanes lobatus]|uniref:rRNA methyltransferase n=1 Tax=Actinoplanes lobatus TaxID=113568 RepID=A0A7W7HFP4_9ACTN|nr:RNA methyltransferase [Actinoplanes lobatus]MBB4749639.1 tRNA G18 (ribose-2'-O)-methylase SpoU [Actinoplanes lobatus]GGN75523.1 rRNA methyltransferase [Actinoplanes lobatus]GIE38378.1 rRNA methyltransferase [Actinoplanes lobatus]
MPALSITSPDDPRIGDYLALTDVELRTRWEPPNGLFIAEGELVIQRALRAGYRMRSALVDEKRADQLTGLPPEAPLYTAPPPVLESITGFHVHRGILASFHRRELPVMEEMLAGARSLAVLEGLNTHTNLGALFRSAAALGIDAVVLSPNCADPLYRRAVRVSMGEVFAIPYAKSDDWPGTLKAIRAAGFSLLAMTPGEGAVSIAGLTPAQRERPALLLGAEGPGLTRTALEAADARVVIPMHNGVDSLNVATAAAIGFYEITR